jgi:hypothetical protein
VGVEETGGNAAAHCPESGAMAPEGVHCRWHPIVIPLERVKLRETARAMMCRRDSRSAALQRRWISSGRHSWLPRAPKRGTWERHNQGEEDMNSSEREC